MYDTRNHVLIGIWKELYNRFIKSRKMQEEEPLKQDFTEDCLTLKIKAS